MATELNLRDFLPGIWHLKRTVNGFAYQGTIAMIGEACFSHQDAGLVYEEKGHYRYLQQHFAFQQTYRYHWEDSRYTVYFRDGRFFYNLLLHDTIQNIHHLCGQDTYRGSFTWRNDDVWALQWQVQGPAKNFTIETIYQRSKGEG